MKSMDKISTGIAYGTSAGSAGYWFLQWLDQVSPSQWAAIGVLGSLVLGFLTYLTNLYFKSEKTSVRLREVNNVAIITVSAPSATSCENCPVWQQSRPSILMDTNDEFPDEQRYSLLRSYLPDALRLRFEDKLTIRAIAQRLGISHSTIHTLFQRFLASGIAWPLPIQFHSLNLTPSFMPTERRN